MHAHVDPELCVGCGRCAEVCPRVFVMQDDLAVVQIDPVPEDAAPDCARAAEDCPVGAIGLT